MDFALLRTLHTSLFPSSMVYPVLDAGHAAVEKDVPTMAESFKNGGYRTAAFVDNSLGASC